MNDGYGILPPTGTDQLPALRSQRREIMNLTAEIREVQARLASLDPSEFWSSCAQRAYRERVEELVHDLRAVVEYLNQAQDQIWRNICRLEAEE